MNSIIENNTINSFNFKIEIAHTIFHILEQIILYLCALRLILYSATNYRIIFDIYWRKKIAGYVTTIDKVNLSKQERRILDRVNDTNLSDESTKKIIEIYLKKEGEQQVHPLYLSVFYWMKGLKHFLLKSQFM